jgi:circadian clock protein KaiB
MREEPEVRERMRQAGAESYVLKTAPYGELLAAIRGEQIIASPTLTRQLPAPRRRFTGSMADKDKILAGLDLRPKDSREAEHE